MHRNVSIHWFHESESDLLPNLELYDTNEEKIYYKKMDWNIDDGGSFNSNKRDGGPEAGIPGNKKQKFVAAAALEEADRLTKQFLSNLHRR